MAATRKRTGTNNRATAKKLMPSALAFLAERLAAYR